MSDTTDPLLVETMARLMSDLVTQDEIERAESEGGWSELAWAALADAGFARVGIDPARGGSGGSLVDLADLLGLVGRYSAPVPLAENAMAGGWLLAEAGLPLPEGVVSAIAEPAIVENQRVRIEGVAAWGRHAATIVAATDDLVVALGADQVSLTNGVNLAGEARERVSADIPIDEVEIGTLENAHERLLRRGALSRVVMAAGALEAMSQMTIDYTNARHQFGQPVARFQAVQHHLITTAQSAVRARMAADIAVRSESRADSGVDVATARVVTDNAVALGTRAAHQAHGAMGVTREYPLHHLSRRLWSWRHEWGTTRLWRRLLGQHVVDGGADALFPTIAG